VVRLPFAVPDHPLTEARLERERMRSHNPFRSYTLPEAMIKFRQGMGRLIRTKTDTGDMVVLDPRIVTRWYGRLFIESLPGVPVRRFRRGVDPGARAE
jgi:ATP-dependent DNA helicase DinG